MSGRAYSLFLLVALVTGLGLTALLVRQQADWDRSTARIASARVEVGRAERAEAALIEARRRIAALEAELAATRQQRDLATARLQQDVRAWCITETPVAIYLAGPHGECAR